MGVPLTPPAPAVKVPCSKSSRRVLSDSRDGLTREPVPLGYVGEGVAVIYAKDLIEYIQTRLDSIASTFTEEVRERLMQSAQYLYFRVSVLGGLWLDQVDGVPRGWVGYVVM